MANEDRAKAKAAEQAAAEAAAAKAAEKAAADRQKMIEEQEARQVSRPVPSNDEVNAAAYYPPRPSKDVGFHTDHSPPPEVEWADGKVLKKRAEAKDAQAKAMEADTGKKGYKTKEMGAKE